MQNIKVINNTFYNNGQTSFGGGIHIENPDAKNVVIRNNIVSQNLSFQIALEGVAPESVTVDHNLVDGYRGYPGEIYGNNSVVGDPLFANAPGGDFHLQGGSPAIDVGSSIDAPADDYDGRPRPQGAGYDMGAFEYGGVGIYAGPGEVAHTGASILSYPNPFRHATTIAYRVCGEGRVSLKVYDLSGRVLRTLVDQFESDGQKAFFWDGCSDDGIEAAPGVYFCRLEAARSIATLKLTLIR
jgi:hypothetical protein